MKLLLSIPLRLVQQDIVKRNQQVQSRINIASIRKQYGFLAKTLISMNWICSIISEINDEHMITILYTINIKSVLD